MGLLPCRYVKLRVAHTSRMPITFSPPPRVSDPDMHHGTCVTHVPWCMPRSLNSGFLLKWWWGKHSRHSWCMRNPQDYVSGGRSMERYSSIFNFSLSYWVIIHHFRFITRGEFWPPGIVVACVCVSVCPCVRVSVCVCINHGLVRTITHHTFKLETPNLK